MNGKSFKYKNVLSPLVSLGQDSSFDVCEDLFYFPRRCCNISICILRVKLDICSCHQVEATLQTNI
jgi:hypothetical protein